MTLEELLTWKARLPNAVSVDIVSEKRFFPGGDTMKTTRLAHARDLIWDKLRELSAPPDYVLMLDLDGVNDNLDGIESCFSLPDGWGGCCVTSQPAYYDVWALRTYDDWMTCDIWTDKRCAEKFRDCSGCGPMTEGEDKSCSQAQRIIPEDSPPIKVRSCFGGAVLYRFSAVQPDMVYEGMRTKPDGRQVNICEHVPFHLSFSQPLYIQPRFRNSAELAHIRCKKRPGGHRVAGHQ